MLEAAILIPFGLLCLAFIIGTRSQRHWSEDLKAMRPPSTGDNGHD